MDGNVPPSMQVAACTWFLYDYLLNFSEEIEFIWAQGKRVTTVPYITTKIVTLAALIAGCATIDNRNISGESCVRLALFLEIAGFAVTAYADLLLTFRLYFMYNCNRRLLAVNLVFYSLVAIASITVNVLNVPSPDDYISSSSTTGSCTVRLRPRMATGWIVGMVFQIYLAVLALAKVRQAHTQQQFLGGQAGLLALLVRGNLQYYATVVAAYGTTAALTLRLSHDQAGSYNLLTAAAMGIFGPKLFRDMRRMLLDSGGHDPTFSTIQFASASRSDTEGGLACTTTSLAHFLHRLRASTPTDPTLLHDVDHAAGGSASSLDGETPDAAA
ncbi:hypothetical protein AURDEDRAFT_183312 [Auricularia subglabra TFB-10046 SS5]|nr:hypothetical protein AURDEDRAFT_183312 [Auricularia subglabra TFB-10046 SS5]